MVCIQRNIVKQPRIYIIYFIKLNLLLADTSHIFTVGSYTISWVTGSSSSQYGEYDSGTPNSLIYFGFEADNLIYQNTGKSKYQKIKHYHSDSHYATIPAKFISSGKAIYFKVGDSTKSNALSSVYQIRPHHHNSSKFIIYGDLGNAVTLEDTLSLLSETIKSKDADAILHIGDIAYDLHSMQGFGGDIFMNSIMPVSTQIPYMFGVGNHETSNNYGHFLHRYRGLGPVSENSSSGSRTWYSFNQGLAHIVVLNTELYSSPINDLSSAQEKWLSNDLIKANQNRDQQPWVIVMGHKCEWHEEDGGIQKLLTIAYTLGADLYFCGHQHNYQRLKPGFVTDYDQTDNPSKLVNPKHWIQILTGAASRASSKYYPNTNAIQVINEKKTLGYGLLEIESATKLQWTFYQTHTKKLKVKSKIVDEFTLVVENHGPRN